MTETKETLRLEAQRREITGKGVRTLRGKRQIPAVLYGHGVKNINLVLDERIFESIYKKAGGTSLIDLVVGSDKPIKVLIHDVQRDPLKGNNIHADLYQVKMTERISAEVQLIFTGVSKAVKDLGGTLVKNLDHLKIECLPQDLVHEIAVDITPLSGFEDMIRVKELKLPPGVTVKVDAEDVVAMVEPPRTEEELSALEETAEKAAVSEVEVVGKKEPKEGEETKEEASPAPTKDKPAKKAQ
ncbi:MAG: 50S ribosomal protein L25 [Patescibacteria group bacterium]|nr:50S ribosomal protein L25 [Patescibacteria group bacterium]MDD5716071.1 50S ribosomal protein L25 [Patescibacteria group bacterium]